ncbi:MAG: single-stranded-DNA-specific exonuclease RecJ [Oligoflexia bacterium]|nr:single-stranded-DNA-specific exonuclease RecJ [Oligoflexia bacterium]
MNTNNPTGTINWHPVLSRFFANKFKDAQHLQQFLSWDLQQLPELTTLRDLEKAAERIVMALKAGEKIAVFGDYDVDGATACALMYRFFKQLGTEVVLYQPNRFSEGYGLHLSSIDVALADGISLLITVDCGITAHQAVTYANEQGGLDIIITDHHTDVDVGMPLPPALAVVNPCRRDEETDSPLRALPGVGVAFVLCLQIKRVLEKGGTKLPSLYSLLPLVAIGGLCDLAPLNLLNLKLIRHGLRQIKKLLASANLASSTTEISIGPGIKMFFSADDVSSAGPLIPSDKIVFDVGPMLNAQGRLQQASAALQLLVSDDEEDVHSSFQQLENSNYRRKEIQKEVYESARNKIIRELNIANQNAAHIGDPIINVVYDSTWHQGVIGIVAAKLVENFRVPAIVLTDEEDPKILRASARTAGNLDLHAMLSKFSDMFLKFGGHPAAAGFSLPKEKFHQFHSGIQQYVSTLPREHYTNREHYDLQLAFEEVDSTLLRQLQLLEPWGMGNRRPVFRMQGVKLLSYSLLKKIHVRWVFTPMELNHRLLRERTLNRLCDDRSDGAYSAAHGAVQYAATENLQLQGISFNYIDKWKVLHPKDITSQQAQRGGLVVDFTLNNNHWQGKEYLQLMVERVSFLSE